MKIREIQTSESAALAKCLQKLEIKSNVELSFEAMLFEPLDSAMTAQEIIQNIHPNGNKIDYADEVSFTDFQEYVGITIQDYYREELLNQSVAAPLDQMWHLVEKIFPMGIKKIVRLGSHVPYVNIWGGETALIFSVDLRNCLLLIVNTSD